MITIQSLKTRVKKTEKEYEVQLVLMDDFISCRSVEEGGEGEALSVQSICGQVM